MRSDAADQRARLWAAGLAISGAALVVASFLPAFELAISASTDGTGAGQSFRYAREVAFVDLPPLGLVPLLAGLVAVAVAVFTFVRGPRWWLALGLLTIALGLAWLLVHTYEQLGGDGSGVLGYDEAGGEPLLEPALEDLRADARQTPEAREPTWALLGENTYAARGLTGWTIVAVATQAVAVLAGYRFVRLVYGLARWSAGLVVAAATGAFWLWFLFHTFTRAQG